LGNLVYYVVLEVKVVLLKKKEVKVVIRCFWKELCVVCWLFV